MANRFMQKGTTKFYFIPTIAASTKIPTAAEVTAGTYIGTDLADVSGFDFANSPIDTPDMDSTFTSSVPGEDKSDTSSLTFYERKGSGNNPAKAALPKGTTGFIGILPYGTAGAAPAAADVIDIWPMQVASVSRAYSAGNEASKYVVTFTITSVPKLDTAIAA